MSKSYTDAKAASRSLRLEPLSYISGCSSRLKQTHQVKPEHYQILAASMAFISIYERQIINGRVLGIAVFVVIDKPRRLTLPSGSKVVYSANLFLISEEVGGVADTAGLLIASKLVETHSRERRGFRRQC